MTRVPAAGRLARAPRTRRCAAQRELDRVHAARRDLERLGGGDHGRQLVVRRPGQRVAHAPRLGERGLEPRVERGDPGSRGRDGPASPRARAAASRPARTGPAPRLISPPATRSTGPACAALGAAHIKATASTAAARIRPLIPLLLRFPERKVAPGRVTILPRHARDRPLQDLQGLRRPRHLRATTSTATPRRPSAAASRARSPTSPASRRASCGSASGATCACPRRSSPAATATG